MEVREDPHEEGRVGGLEVVPDHVQDGEHDVEAVRQVQADQQLVKHVPHLRPVMYRWRLELSTNLLEVPQCPEKALLAKHFDN